MTTIKMYLKNLIMRFSLIPSKIKSKIAIRKLKRLKKVTDIDIQLIGYLLRNRNKDRHADNIVPDMDTVTFITVARLCDLGYDKNKFEEFERENQKAIEDEMQAALQNSEIKSWIAILYELNALYAKTENLNEQYSELRAKARTFDTGTIEIRIYNLRIIESMIRIYWQSKPREITLPAKISLNATQLGTYITIVSSVFLVTGYLYMTFFLRQFGIKVSFYFSLTDYLASKYQKYTIRCRWRNNWSHKCVDRFPHRPAQCLKWVLIMAYVPTVCHKAPLCLHCYYVRLYYFKYIFL